MTTEAMTLKALTANRLGDGRVVYLDRAGGWSERVADSRTAPSDTAAEAMTAAGAAAEAARRVIGAYLIDVVERDGGPAPVSLREAIRASGPTVRADHGAIDAGA